MIKGTHISRRARWLAAGFAMVVASTAFYIPTAAAHGEKAQAAFLRMRTVHWYDLTWSDEKVAVNEPYSLSGRFYIFEDWPQAVTLPKVSYLNVGQSGPIMFRTGIYVNELFVPRSIGLETGGHYTFRVEEVARRPGKWHVHCLLNVQGGGPLVGPGKWVTITGNLADFAYKVTTLTGETIDLASVGTASVYSWHLFWYALGIAWLVWWARRPLFLTRYMQVQAAQQEDDLKGLITSGDKKAAGVALAGTLFLVIYGFSNANEEFPITIPLQAGLMYTVEPLPVNYNSMVTVNVLNATYRVPGRSLRFKAEITNHTDRPLYVAEFETGGIRFINPEVDVETAGYPDNILAPEGLSVSQDQIKPGETAVVEIGGTDAAWEVQRLAQLANGVDMRFGGLLFFQDEKGNRIPIEVQGPLIPVYV